MLASRGGRLTNGRKRAQADKKWYDKLCADSEGARPTTMHESQQQTRSTEDHGKLAKWFEWFRSPEAASKKLVEVTAAERPPTQCGVLTIPAVKDSCGPPY